MSLVERKAYILPLDIVALEETMTTKGMGDRGHCFLVSDWSISTNP